MTLLHALAAIIAASTILPAALSYGAGCVVARWEDGE